MTQSGVSTHDQVVWTPEEETIDTELSRCRTCKETINHGPEIVFCPWCGVKFERVFHYWHKSPSASTGKTWSAAYSAIRVQSPCTSAADGTGNNNSAWCFPLRCFWLTVCQSPSLPYNKLSATSPNRKASHV